MTENRDSEARKWLDEAEEALNRASEAVKTAWEGTKDTRMSALEAAREAATQLGKVIDQGIDVARETWGSTKGKEGETVVGEPASPAPAPPISGDDEGTGAASTEESEEE
jgi:hypothetical protein